MEIQNHVNNLNAMISQGAMVDAVKKYFADNATTSDFSGVTTANKTDMVGKMEAFTGAIANVKEITHHGTTFNGNVSASEYTFNFEMKDNSEVLWHEIIKRTWNDKGQITSEAYFKS